MADEHLTAEKIEMLEGAFLDARLGLILERLAQSDCTLENFEETFASLLKEYAISPNELETIKKSSNFDHPAPDARFLHACIAALMVEPMRLMQHLPNAVEAINRAAYLMSAEQHYNAILDDNILATTAAQTGTSMQQLRDIAHQQVKDPNSQLWRGFVDKMQHPDPDFKYLRGDYSRGVFQYCEATDYEYACSMLMGEDLDEEAPVFSAIAKSFATMETDEMTDEYIEHLCAILPKLYMYSDPLVCLHTDPDKAIDAYNEAVEKRPSTEPANPRYTKDVYPGKIKTAEVLAEEEEENLRLAEEKRQRDAEAARLAAEEAEKKRAAFAEKIKKFDTPRLIALIASAVLLLLMLTVFRFLYVLPFMITMCLINGVNAFLYIRSKGAKHPLSIASIVLTILYFVI